MNAYYCLDFSFWRIPMDSAAWPYPFRLPGSTIFTCYHIVGFPLYPKVHNAQVNSPLTPSEIQSVENLGSFQACSVDNLHVSHCAHDRHDSHKQKKGVLTRMVDRNHKWCMCSTWRVANRKERGLLFVSLLESTLDKTVSGQITKISCESQNWISWNAT